MKNIEKSGPGDVKVDSGQRPALDATQRDDIGVRLRHEHVTFVLEPLPAKMRHLLGILARARPSAPKS